MAFNNIYKTLFGILRGKSLSAIYVNNNNNSFGMRVHKIVYSFKTRLAATTNLLCVLYISLYHNSYVYVILCSEIN